MDTTESVWRSQSVLPLIDESFVETHANVGPYTVLWDLGKGEFGLVRAVCVREAGAKHADLALKSIKKCDVSFAAFHPSSRSRLTD